MPVEIQDFEMVPQAQAAPEPPNRPSPTTAASPNGLTPCDLERLLRRQLERAARVWAW